MKTVTASSRQSWYDISTKFTGTPANAYELAMANGYSVTDTLASDQQIIIPDGLEIKREALQYYAARKIDPATDLTITDADLLQNNFGIGMMIIGSTFKVG